MYSLLSNISLIAVFIASYAGTLYFVDRCHPVMVYSGTIPHKVLYHVGRGLSALAIGLVVGTWGELLLRQLPFATLNYAIEFAFAWAIGLHLMKRKDTFSLSSQRFPIMLGALSIVRGSSWFFIFVFLAALSGGMLEGGRLMIAFWLGTLPVLFARADRYKATQGNSLTARLLSCCALLLVGVMVAAVHRLNPMDIHFDAEIMEPLLPSKCIH